MEKSKEEIYGLTSQLRQAAVSIPANIAEGFKKKGKNDKVRFMNIRQGPIEECRYYLIPTKDLGYAVSRNKQTSPQLFTIHSAFCLLTLTSEFCL